MGITTYAKFDLFKDKIFSLSTPLQKEAIISSPFLLEQSPENNLSIYYAPVEYFNENATILIVGITPGFHQMQKAYSAVLRAKGELIDNEELLHQAKLASRRETSLTKQVMTYFLSSSVESKFGVDPV